MVVLAKLQPRNYTCVVPTHPALPHSSAAYLTPCVCITVPEQSCLLAQFPQGNPPKAGPELQSFCSGSLSPKHCCLSGPFLEELQGQRQHSRETRSKHFLSSMFGFTWQVSKFSLAGGRLGYKQNEEASKGCGPGVTSTAWLRRQSHGSAFCPALCLWLRS